jgi:hypothetical protein
VFITAANFSQFRIRVSDNQQLQAALWVTGRQLARCQESGQFMVLDFTSRTNNSDLPAAVFTTLDANGKVVTLAYEIAESESLPIISWCLEALKEMVPNLSPGAVFTDGVLMHNPEVVTDVFPDAEHRLCRFHLFSLDVPANLRNMPRYAEALRVRVRVRVA